METRGGIGNMLLQDRQLVEDEMRRGEFRENSE
jgi:hypothetical protein